LFYLLWVIYISLCFWWLGTSGLKVFNIQLNFHSSFSLDSQLLCCSFCSQQIERQVFLAPWVYGLHFTFLFSPSLMEYNPLYGKYKTTWREYQRNFTMDIRLYNGILHLAPQGHIWVFLFPILWCCSSGNYP
jgi:hypothetical protein